MADPNEGLGPGEVLHLSTAHRHNDAGELKSALGSILARHGFLVDEYQPDKLLIIPDEKVVEYEAMHMGLRKRLAPQAQIEQGVEFDAFDANVREAFENVGSRDFFSPAEVSMLTHRILSYIKVWMVPPFLHPCVLPTKQRGISDTRLITVCENVTAIIQVDEDFAAKLGLHEVVVHPGERVLTALTRTSIIEDVMPVHDAVLHQTMMPKFWSPFPATSAIRRYYGDSVALYFEWMQFMWTWLTVPGLMGLGIYITHQFTGPFTI